MWVPHATSAKTTIEITLNYLSRISYLNFKIKGGGINCPIFEFKDVF